MHARQEAALTQLGAPAIRAGVENGAGDAPRMSLSAYGALVSAEVNRRKFYPPDARGTGAAGYPWGLKPQSTLTNSAVPYAVKNVDGRTLTVSYHGREAKIVIADDTPVVSFAPAIRADVAAGAPVFVPAERGSDGALVVDERARIDLDASGPNTDHASRHGLEEPSIV